jgi:hypothetical protein
MTATLIAARDYKYTDGRWARDVAESFQLVDEKRTDFVISAGYVTEQTESEYSFYNRIAPSNATPETPPPYYFPDGTFRYDAAYSLQLTDRKTTSYASTGSSSLSVTTAVFNPATGQFDTTTITVAGNAPRATTVASTYTTTVQQPIAGTLIDDCIDAHYVPGKVGLNLQWAESQAEANTAARRQMQRDSAITRRVKCAANPQMRLGDTVELIDQKRDVAAKHVIVAKRTTRNLETGAADQQLTLEFWIR